MNLATVFDGALPASADPGVALGAPVVVWTPPVSGSYQLHISAPDEPGAPFSFASGILVDAEGVGIMQPALVAGSGTVVDEYQPVDVAGPSLSLQTALGTAVRVVVRVALETGFTAATPVPDIGIVPLDVLKLALGIAASDTSEDLLLEQLGARATAWVEEQLERRFQTPAARVEYQFGNGTRTLYLQGHVQLLETTPEDGYVAIRERSAPGDWTAFTAFEVRGDTLIRTDGYRWHPALEYELTYQDGFDVAPGDIQSLVIELVSGARDYAGAAEAGLKSESIGDYSYTLDTALAAALTGMGDGGKATLNRRRRKHI